MHRFFRILSFVLLLVAGAAYADIRIASWNIERLGHGGQKSYPALAVIGSEFDFIAVQEAMTADGLGRLRKALEQHTAEGWELMYSHLIGRGTHKEKYAFVWRSAVVEYVDGAVVYLDTTDRYAREPYSARFRSKHTGAEFVAATVHILYGQSAGDRTPEIGALADYWQWLSEVYPGTPRILMGDFNLAPDHEAWAPLKETARPLVTQGATTVSSIDGRFANLYDNIWVSVSTALQIAEAGAYNGPAALGWSHEKYRKHVSDHIPVYVTLGRAQVSAQLPATTVRSKGTSEQEAPTPAAPRDAPANDREVRGNRNSKIYHAPSCPSYNKVSDANRIRFRSEEEAVAAGYRKAHNCP